MPDPRPLYRVHLVDEATVVSRGERVRVWFLRERDAWVRASDAEGANVDLDSAESGGDSCPPGTIWQRSIELLLPAGTELLCRVTTPRTERLDPIDYLRRGKLGTHRHTDESIHRVVGNYRLSRLPKNRSD